MPRDTFTDEQLRHAWAQARLRSWPETYEETMVDAARSRQVGDAQFRRQAFNREYELGNALHRVEVAELPDHPLPLADGQAECQQGAQDHAADQEHDHPACQRLQHRFHHSLATCVAST